ncbi:MFS transporter [Hephaestia mangrovi]|uniref:MFS transporter n=1 Tax=Hephaestia mangrovi TaxID=2873268 RepID=UPI001CA74DAF|nr:MFS transporter [Hephaestia mangrovi]MBY8829901.1 MFS transporter [Hephaestia mangrovi]
MAMPKHRGPGATRHDTDVVRHEGIGCVMTPGARTSSIRNAGGQPGGPSDIGAARAVRGSALGVRFKIEYGVGAMANGLVTAGLAFFLLFYLTAVCGLSGSLAGTAQLIALLVDAVADPVIGLASDRIRSRLGRRLPFMMISILPFAGSFALLFSIPRSLAGSWLFLYVTACLILSRLSLSGFVLPFTAVGAEVTDEYRERASVVAYRLTFDHAGALCAFILGLGVFMSGPSGLLARGNYLPFGWVCAAIVLLTGLIAGRAVRRVLPRLHSPPPSADRFLASIFREAKELSRNRSFLLLFGTIVVYFLAYSISAALTLYAGRYFWKLDTLAIQLILISATLGPLLGVPISAIALRFVEKRAMTITAYFAIALFQLWPPLLQLYGPITLSPAIAAVVLVVNGVLAGTAIMVAGIGFQSMLADTADEHEWLFGVRREGLFFSGLTLGYKAAAGIGGLIAGVALDAIDFPTDLGAKGAALPIPGNVIAKLALIAGPLPAAFSAIAPLFLLGYSLSQKKHAQIVAALDKDRRLPKGTERSKP